MPAWLDGLRTAILALAVVVCATLALKWTLIDKSVWEQLMIAALGAYTAKSVVTDLSGKFFTKKSNGGTDATNPTP